MSTALEVRLPIYVLDDLVPTLDLETYVHPDVVSVGDVRLAGSASVWPGAVLRATTGATWSARGRPCRTAPGRAAVVGHNTHLEGCAAEELDRVGCGGALNCARVDADSVVGAWALVTEDMQVPPGPMALGVPARSRAMVGQKQATWVAYGVRTYLELAARYRTGLRLHDPAHDGSGVRHELAGLRSRHSEGRPTRYILLTFDAADVVYCRTHQQPGRGLSMTLLADQDTSGAGPVDEPVVQVVDFDTAPDRYRHWQLAVDGPVATLTLLVDEKGGIVSGYELKMNSYDLGVDIELYDAVQRLRFEHPTVKAVVLTGGLDRMFCAGANIRMLAQSSHAWKVNFCKFTNETRNGIEDATASSGQTWIAALNGTAAGGGYELALACEQIVLVDDGSSAVSLPEVPLLGVLPGTGGLTRVVDKRFVRKDLADVFATRTEGIRGATAVQWRLVDETAPLSRFGDVVQNRALAAAGHSFRPDDGGGVHLMPLDRDASSDGIAYPHVNAVFDRAERRVNITVLGPQTAPPDGAAGVLAEGVDYWPLAVARELDDLVLRLRTNELELGTWVLRTQGDPSAVLAYDAQLDELADDWFVNEVTQYWKRTLKRLDVTSRSLFAVIETGSCFVGSLLELALACDRQYMLDGVLQDVDPDAEPAVVQLGAANLGRLPMGNGLTRLQSRYYGQGEVLDAVLVRQGEPLDAAACAELGLVTLTPDDLDWDDELRIGLEERASLSPDALTGMEANHRFVGPETVETKVFGRLTAWQNWIFLRPNASGPDGALRRFGSGTRAAYDTNRV